SGPTSTYPSLRVIPSGRESLEQRVGVLHRERRCGRDCRVRQNLPGRRKRSHRGLRSVAARQGWASCLWTSLLKVTPPATASRIPSCVPPGGVPSSSDAESHGSSLAASSPTERGTTVR